MAVLSVNVPEYVIWRSAVRWPSSYRAGDAPSYEPFFHERRLEFVECVKSSSIVGPSAATIRFAPGWSAEKRPDSLGNVPPNDDRPEVAARTILKPGDRAAIGLRSAGRVQWLWAGYVTTAAIMIDGRSESMTWRLYGPEWVWGIGGQNVGAHAAVYGQYRRVASADDAFVKGGGVTPANAIKRFSDLPTIFNPGGRANMTSDDVRLTGSTARIISGRIWEEPDRMKSATPLSVRWNALDAARTLTSLYNDPDKTKIAPPADWNQVAMKASDVIRETAVEGQSLYEALRAVFGSRFGFYISPTPKQISGGDWGPFDLVFFSRSRAEGSKRANLSLDAPGTAMASASASVKRLESARDVTKTVNRVVVGAKFVRHVRLVFWGDAKPSSVHANYELLPGWNTSEALLKNWSATTDDVEGKDAVNEVTIGRTGGTGTRADWLSRFVSTGTKFQENAHVFRRFVWNESGEYLPDKSVSFGGSGGGNTYPYKIPDLGKIAAPQKDEDDSVTESLPYSRRRRPLLDSVFRVPGSPDNYHRVPPTLYIAIASAAGDPNFAKWKWSKVPESAWQPDKHRAGFWITVEDVASWRPFKRQDRGDDESDANALPEDQRTFATLLNSGRLRLCYEGSIEIDHAMERVAMPTADNGTAHLRETFIRTGASYVKTLVTKDGLVSPSKLTPAIVDLSTAAQDYADLLRDAGQEQKVNASILVEADWPEQSIGSLVSEISGGRSINLATGPSGRGAQIVAVKLDIRNNCWELLTESAAMALVEKDRRRLASGTRVYSENRKEQERQKSK